MFGCTTALVLFHNLKTAHGITDCYAFGAIDFLWLFSILQNHHFQQGPSARLNMCDERNHVVICEICTRYNETFIFSHVAFPMLALEFAKSSVSARTKCNFDGVRFTHDGFQVGPFQMHRQHDHFEICTRHNEILRVCFMLFPILAFQVAKLTISARTKRKHDDVRSTNDRFAIRVPWLFSMFRNHHFQQGPDATINMCDERNHVVSYGICTRHTETLRFGCIAFPMLAFEIANI